MKGLVLIALAKARPGVLNFSGGGIGAGTHLLAAWFFQAAQIKAAYIPYATGGTAQSAIDTVAGRADAAIVTYFSAKPFLTTQRLRVLAISAARPSALLPDVPAILSQGVPGFETYTFNGFVGVEEFTEGGLGIADTTRIAEQGALVPHRYFHANKPVRLQNVRGVLWAGMQRVNDGIASELRSAGFNDVRVIGDGIAPRRQGAKSSNASHRRRA